MKKVAKLVGFLGCCFLGPLCALILTDPLGNFLSSISQSGDCRKDL